MTVFAASSLHEMLSEIAVGFQDRNPGVSVELNFAGSQRLRTQLEHGAAADVFASADAVQMDLAEASGLLIDSPTIFAYNKLVVVTPRPTDDSSSSPRQSNEGAKLPAKVGEVRRLADLANDGVKLALGLAEVPAGRYARAVLQNLSAHPDHGPAFARLAMSNVVSEEGNVRNISQKVALGEVDAGIVYISDLAVPYIGERVAVVEIPEEFNVVAEYPIAALKSSRHPTMARDFVDFLLSPLGRSALRKHGFSTSPG